MAFTMAKITSIPLGDPRKHFEMKYLLVANLAALLCLSVSILTIPIGNSSA